MDGAEEMVFQLEITHFHQTNTLFAHFSHNNLQLQRSSYCRVIDCHLRVPLK